MLLAPGEFNISLASCLCPDLVHESCTYWMQNIRISSKQDRLAREQ